MNGMATEEAMRMNLRRRRAQELMWTIMHELDDVLPYELHRDVCDRLQWTLVQNGAYIMTDADRADAGLEPRDDKGWTFSERVQEKLNRQQAMLAMLAPFVPLPKATTPP